MPSVWLAVLHNVRIVAAAFGGGLACYMVDLPAAWLTGGMLAAAIAVSGFGWAAPSRRVVDTAMLFCGLLLGSTATPEALAAAARYPGSLALMLIAVAAIMLVTGGYLERFAGWPRLDAILASAPGALSAVMAVAYERNVGLSRIAVIQLFRIFALVAAMPSLIVYAGITPADLRPPPAAIVSPPGLLGLGVAGVAVAMAFERFRLSAPLILGGTLGSAMLHAGGWVHGTLPPEVATGSFILLSAVMGGRFGTVTPSGLLAAMPAALVAFLTSMAVALLLAWPAAKIAGAPYAAAIIAFAPGGLEAMAVLAFMLGLDPLYVGAHHLLRFMAVGFGLPFFVGWMTRREASAQSSDIN